MLKHTGNSVGGRSGRFKRIRASQRRISRSKPTQVGFPKRSICWDRCIVWVRASAAALRSANKKGRRVLPEGSVVLVESSSDAGKTVNIRWQNEELWTFAVDFNQRSALVPPGTAAHRKG